jgi:IS30 family transposase
MGYFEYMAMTEKIRVLLVKQGNISEAELARRLGQTPSNLHNKMKRDNFSEKELREIAEVMGCGLEIHFVRNGTGEEL